MSLILKALEFGPTDMVLYFFLTYSIQRQQVSVQIVFISFPNLFRLNYIMILENDKMMSGWVC
jgi:hypothetical protein